MQWLGTRIVDSYLRISWDKKAVVPLKRQRTNNLNVNETNSWGKEQVGQIWWNLNNAKFICFLCMIPEKNL